MNSPIEMFASECASMEWSLVNNYDEETWTLVIQRMLDYKPTWGWVLDRWADVPANLRRRINEFVDNAHGSCHAAS